MLFSTERTLRQGVTKQLQKEFDEINQNLINLVRSNKKFEKENLPNMLRTILKELKQLVKDETINIRIVDKGNLILNIDFEERLKLERTNINKIAKRCDDQ